MEKELKRWVMNRVNAELEQDYSKSKKDAILEVLTQFVRAGDAERYVRKDGHLAWRVTEKFRDWLKDGECDVEDYAHAS